MDINLYQKKLQQILFDKKPKLNYIYQRIKPTKNWKIVSKRCSVCGTGFNQNHNGKFQTHICKTKKSKYKPVNDD